MESNDYRLDNLVFDNRGFGATGGDTEALFGGAWGRIQRQHYIRSEPDYLYIWGEKMNWFWKLLILLTFIMVAFDFGFYVVWVIVAAAKGII